METSETHNTKELTPIIIIVIVAFVVLLLLVSSIGVSISVFVKWQLNKYKKEQEQEKNKQANPLTQVYVPPSQPLKEKAESVQPVVKSSKSKKKKESSRKSAVKQTTKPTVETLSKPTVEAVSKPTVEAVSKSIEVPQPPSGLLPLNPTDRQLTNSTNNSANMQSAIPGSLKPAVGLKSVRLKKKSDSKKKKSDSKKKKSKRIPDTMDCINTIEANFGKAEIILPKNTKSILSDDDTRPTQNQVNTIQKETTEKTQNSGQDGV